MILSNFVGKSKELSKIKSENSFNSLFVLNFVIHLDLKTSIAENMERQIHSVFTSYFYNVSRFEGRSFGFILHSELLRSLLSNYH